MSKKFATHCSLINYLKDSKYKSYYELIHGTCIDITTLANFRNKAGITLLIPTDKSVLKKIEDLAVSDNVDDVNKAGDMINAMIFRDVYKTPSDWVNSKDNIPNSLYPSQHVPIQGASGGDTITFASGAVAKIDPDFKDSSRRQNLAVWLLEKGEIPVTTDKPATLTFGKKGDNKRGKKGGYEVSAEQSSNIRFQIAVAVENIYMADRSNSRRYGPGATIVGGCDHNISGNIRDAFCEFTMSLTNFAMNVRRDDNLFYGRILPMISFQKIDFYNLIEPHKTSDSYLLPTSFIRDWWNNRGSFDLGSVMKQVHDKMANVPQQFRGAKIYSDPRAVIETINDCRTDIMGVFETRPRQLPEAIAKVYQELSTANRVSNMSDVYPSELATYYAAEPGLKLMQDELRYLTFLMFESLEAEHTFDRNRYSTIINMIAECMYATDKARALKLVNANTLKYMIQPNERIAELKTFVCSTMFLWSPVPPEICKNYPIKSVRTRPVASDTEAIWNIDQSMLSKHKRLADSANSEVAGIVSRLRDMDPAAIDDKIKAELISIYNKLSV